MKASTLGGAIELGQKLAINADGTARALQTRLLDGMTVSESAPTIGIAMEALEAGTDGLIWVLVNIQ